MSCLVRDSWVQVNNSRRICFNQNIITLQLKMKLFALLLTILVVTPVLGANLMKVPSRSSAVFDPDFANATLIRSFTTLQLVTKSKIINLINLPDVRQATHYTCGPSSLQAVLMYYGEEVIECQLAEQAHATYDDGTSIHEILRVARKYGLKGDHHFNMTLSDLTGYLDQNIPVIVLIQAWVQEEQEDIDWENLWDDGHYVVAIGYDDKFIYFEDPSILGGIGYIPKAEFLLRWHDYDTNVDDKYVHYGLPLEGKKSWVETAQYIG